MSYQDRLYQEQVAFNKSMWLDDETMETMRNRLITLYGYQMYRGYFLPNAIKSLEV